VSVIIPVYNCEQYLAEAIESVRCQTGSALEVIVVDDGSTDASAEVARSFGSSVRYCYQAHAGIGAARNCGIAAAGGNLYAFLDADDRWVAGKLAKQIAVLEDDDSLDMVFGQVVQLQDGPEWQRGIAETGLAQRTLMPGISPGTVLMKRSAFDRVGPFKTDLKVGEFIDWYARAMELGLRSKMLPDLFLWRRLHQANQGVRERQSATDYARVLKASLDRRRARKSL
jgi:glycosyltransferase involved in cell wall biosynthesis